MDINELKTEIAKLPEGQQIHLANHMWKHYGVGPTKLIKALDSVTDSLRDTGDLQIWTK